MLPKGEKIMPTKYMDMNQYLQETAMLDFSNPDIQKLIEVKHWKEQNKFDCLKAIYNFVRDDIAFGYNTDDGDKKIAKYILAIPYYFYAS